MLVPCARGASCGNYQLVVLLFALWCHIARTFDTSLFTGREKKISVGTIVATFPIPLMSRSYRTWQTIANSMSIFPAMNGCGCLMFSELPETLDSVAGM
uniref:Putative secreted protein n=1 Tax=Anopheles marajoara TaxID=58244 RepID=A0A2M4C960_9DIPT